MGPIHTFVDNGVLRVMVSGPFDMGLVFDLWQSCQLEYNRYHTYLFDLRKVGELRDSGLAWLRVFNRRAAKAGVGILLMNCRPEIAKRCVSAGLKIGLVAPHLAVHAASADTVYLTHGPRKVNHASATL
jgi:ABC-type transporter Mla MlaB component